MAYALSQIFVVNTAGGNVVGDNALTQATYYDIFVKQAFGSYREVLEQVTYSPVMGFYLSHLRNRKSDPEINRFPAAHADSSSEKPVAPRWARFP